MTLLGLYDRQEKLELSIPSSVAVIGVGGVGFWVAYLAAMSSIPKIFLFDGDTVDETNLNRLPMLRDDIGRKKVEVAREKIIGLRPRADVICIPQNVSPDNLKMVIGKDTVMVDCTDNIESQRGLYGMCNESGIRYIRAGYDGTHITIADSVPGWGQGIGRYTVFPSWVVPTVMVAAMAIGKMCKYPALEFSGEIDEILNRREEV